MRFRRIHTPEAKSAEASFRNGPLNQKRSGFLTAVALTSSLLFGGGDALAQDVKPPVAEAKKDVKPALDWKRTHLVIIRGKDVDIENEVDIDIDSAVKAGRKNKAASIHFAGKIKQDETGLYGRDSFEIKRIFEDVRDISKRGDTIFIYIAGHGKKGAFFLSDKTELKYEKLLELMEKNFKGRKVIFASDSCHSNGFVDFSIESKKFPDLTVMSTGSREEPVVRKHFDGLWHALSSNLDLDGDGIATLEEAFQYGLRADYCGLRAYPKFFDTELGTYRSTLDGDGIKEFEMTVKRFYEQGDYGSIVHVFSWEEVGKELGTENAIDLLNSAIRDADPIVKAYAARLLGDAAEKTDISIAVPTLVNALTSQYGWVRRNAARALMNASERVDISIAVPALVKALSDENEYVRIGAAMSLVNASEKTDISIAVPALVKALSDKSWNVRECAAMALWNTAEKIDLSTYDGVIGGLSELSKDESIYVRKVAAEALEKITKR